MHTLETRVATGVYDPGNPTQRAEIYYAGWPGQYASFYTNAVPYDARVNLGGVGLGAGLTGLSLPVQLGIFGLLSVAIYFGAKKFLGPRRRR